MIYVLLLYCIFHVYKPASLLYALHHSTPRMKCALIRITNMYIIVYMLQV